MSNWLIERSTRRKIAEALGVHPSEVAELVPKKDELPRRQLYLRFSCQHLNIDKAVGSALVKALNIRLGQSRTVEKIHFESNRESFIVG